MIPQSKRMKERPPWHWGQRRELTLSGKFFFIYSVNVWRYCHGRCQINQNELCCILGLYFSGGRLYGLIKFIFLYLKVMSHWGNVILDQILSWWTSNPVLVLFLRFSHSLVRHLQLPGPLFPGSAGALSLCHLLRQVICPRDSGSSTTFSHNLVS